jgi:coiled-coil domain-containing protein 63/114
MDQYIRNVRVIEDAFDQIKESSGINNIQEIVTTFIKAEEQNYSLFNYVNMLNTETDALEESNKEIKDQINKIKERGDMNEQ